MGTNYYLVKNRPTVQEPIHIGKSSGGWLFCFQRQNQPWLDDPIVWNTWPQVHARLQQLTEGENRYVILNEYDEPVSFREFEALVQCKQEDPACSGNPDNFRWSDNVDGYRFTDGDFR